MRTDDMEHWRDRFALECTSRIFGRCIINLTRLGARFTVSASSAFAIHFLPYPIDVTALYIEDRGNTPDILQALATSVEGTFPYPALRELHMTHSDSWLKRPPRGGILPILYGPAELMEKAEIESLLWNLWESRGPLSNQPVVLDVFNSRKSSVYRHWSGTGSTRVELDLG